MEHRAASQLLEASAELIGADRDRPHYLSPNLALDLDLDPRKIRGEPIKSMSW